MRRAPLSLVAVCTTWGTIPLLAGEIDLSPAAIVFVRVWVGAAGLALVAAARGRSHHEATAPAPRLTARAVAVGPLLALHWTAMFAGYQHASDDLVVFVVFLAPIGIAVAAPLVLGERLGSTTIAALAVAVVGFVCITGPSLGDRSATSSDEALGVAFAALSAVTLVVLILASKPLAETHGGFRLARIELTGAGLVLLPFAVTFDWGHPSPTQWLWLLVLGLVHTSAGSAIYLSALSSVPATQVGILGYLEPVAVVAFTWLILSDPPSATTVVGGALIVAAGLLVVRAAPAAAPEVPVHVPG